MSAAGGSSLLLLLLSSALAALGVNAESSYGGSEVLGELTDSIRQWDPSRSNVPWASLVEAVMQAVKSTEDGGQSSCSTDIEAFLSELKTSQPAMWALSMLDSFGKPTAGILKGGIRWIGSYKQCRSVAYENLTSNQAIRGEYCWAYFTVNPSFKKVVAPQVEGNIAIQVAICAPRSCNNSQLLHVGKAITELNSVKQFNKYLNLSDIKCLRDRHISLNTTDGCLLIFYIILIVLVFVATANDLAQRFWKKREPQIIAANNNQGESSSRSWLMAFSAYSNGQKLLNLKGGDRILPAINALRVISLFWVVFSHSVLAFLVPAVNMPTIVEQSRSYSITLIRQGVFAVITFIFLSGFLHAKHFLNEHDRSGGNISWLKFYLHRYWRLTPAYLLVLGSFFVALYKYTGQGPFWSMVTTKSEVCSKYWWANALYINNLMPSDKQCMSHSWYLAVDMQLFLISPLFLIPLTKSLRWALSSTILAILGSAVLSGFIGIYYDISTDYDFFKAPPGSTKHDDDFNIFYGKPYRYLGVYLVGMITGRLLQNENRSNIPIPKAAVAIGWTMSLATLLTLIFIVKYPVREYFIFRVLYHAFSPVAWAIAIAWIVVACWTGHGGIVSRFLSLPIWNPLSRLSYCTYLWHTAGVYWVWGNTDVATHYNGMFSHYPNLGNVILVFAGSVVVSLLFEAPFVALERHILRRKPTPNKNN